MVVGPDGGRPWISAAALERFGHLDVLVANAGAALQVDGAITAALS
jgi:NADP-dependent 3-hydroxy acid dehydrogenase YdfG